MGTILESVNNLSEKLGIEKREQTIKDQLDLCVERLGGEGNSKDIAESANKFADKEDGTATFTTKSITENGTYAASDDNVSGYSSVTVNVSGGVGFTKMGIYAIIRNEEDDGCARESITFINNTETSVDVSELRTDSIIVINPVDELKVRPLASVGAGYSVSFIPTATCKVYEDETELDLNDIFQSQQTPTGPTVYNPNGLKAHFIRGTYSPYDGQVRKLYDTEHDGFDFTLE